MLHFPSYFKIMSVNIEYSGLLECYAMATGK